MLALVLAVAPTAAQQPANGQTRGFTVFLNEQAVGVENVLVESDAGGLVIVSQGRLDPPLNLELRFAEVRYAADDAPQLLSVESMVGDTPSLLETRFDRGVAWSTGINGNVDIDRTDPVSVRPVVLVSGFFGAYEAVTRRLTGAEVGTELRAYVAPQAEVAIRLTALVTEIVQTPNSTLELLRYDVVVVDPAGEVPMSLTAEPDGSLARIVVPDQSLQVLRNDLASPLTRTVTFTNPGDERATIPASGFSLVGTLTLPEGPEVWPAAVLVSGVSDRDGTLSGVPTLAHLAGALAEAGIASIRYDRRGTGQSGGRVESATLDDYVEDTRSAFEWLEDRDDINEDLIAIVGIGDGAWVALQAAADEHDFAAVVSVSAPSTPGAEFSLDSLERSLVGSALTPDEVAARLELQRQIVEAVLTGVGWDQLSDEVRRQADTPWFQSYLAFDPAEAIEDIRSPMLFVAAGAYELVPSPHAEQLGTMARAEGEVDVIEVMTVSGMDDGGVEPGAPAPRISGGLMTAVVDWLVRTFAQAR